MGQAGSVEQRNAIRDVITIKPSTGGASSIQDRDAIVAALRAFCKMFPMEEALAVSSTTTATTDDGNGSSGGGGAFDVKESKLFFVMHALLQHATERTEKNSKEDLIELTLTSFKRVILWRELYRLGAKCSMKPFLNCLLLSPTLAKSALQVLLTLTGVCPGTDANEKTDKWESLNRRNLGDSGGYDVLRSLLVDYSSTSSTVSGTSPAVTAVAVVREKETVLLLVLELFHAALVTRRHTTDTATTTQAVGALLNARISLLNLCHHTNKSIQEFALELVKELFFIIDLEQVHELQESAREYGALLYALSAAITERKKGFGSHVRHSRDDRNSSGASSDDGDDEQLTPTNSAQALVKTYTELVEMFTAGNTRSKKAISRIFPVELFIPLENRADLISRHTASSLLKNTRNNRSLPSFTFDFELRSSLESKRHRGTSFATGGSKQSGSGSGGGAFEKWLHEARIHGEDWKHIIECVHETHERPDLVWRSAMRDELRQALRGEIDKLERLKRAATSTNAGSVVRWDHEMFYVEYQSIQKELVVNGYFVEYLIPMLADLSNQFEVVEPLVLAWHLSDRLAVEADESWKILCLRCLRLLIRRYAMVLHGQLPTRHVLELLRGHSRYSPPFIRECFLLLNTAIMTTQNAPSENINQTNALVATTVVDVLSDSVLISSLSHSPRASKNEQKDDLDPIYDFDEEQVYIRNASDGLVRAGVSVLQAIIRRFKYTLQLVRPKRAFMCRLLAVETLDHVTTNRILTILKQLAHLDAVASIGGSSGSGSSNGTPSVDANWKSLALVYLLVSCCDPKGRGMSPAAAEFLKENYSATVASSSSSSTPKSPPSSATSKDREKKRSRSEFKELLNDAVGFDGCGIGSLLASSDATFFCEVFNADEKRSADVWWGRRQRQSLFRYLKRKFVASALAVAASNQAEEMYDAVLVGAEGEPNDAAAVDTMSEEIFVGNIFLHSYVEGDGQFLNEWTPEMYRSLIDALFARLMELSRTRSVFGGGEQVHPVASTRHGTAPLEPWQVQVLIIKALVRLLPTHCATIEITSEFYETLLLPLRRSLLGESDQIRASLALELMIALLHVPEDKGSNAATCRQFLTESGLVTISEALVKMLNPAYQQLLKGSVRGDASASLNMARVLLSRATDLVTTLSVEPEGVCAIQQNPSVLAALLDLSSKQNISCYSAEAAATSLLCLARLCQHDELLAAVVGAGGLLLLIDVCVFCPVGSDHLVDPPAPPSQSQSQSPSPSQSGDPAETNNPDESEAKQRAALVSLPPVAAAVRAAAMALQTCLCDSDGTESASSAPVLKQLLTPSFVRILRLSPVRFVRRVQTKDDICSSTLIWTATMRKRLSDTLSIELAKVKTAARSNIWPRWNPDHFVAADSFRYQYPELADELIVHDVYINKFVSSDGVSLEDIDMSALSQALLISIQSGENVLRILQQRGASDPAKERSIVVMRLALNKLVSMHPQHNLQVDRTPPTSIGMTSLIENESSDEESDSDDDTSTAGSSVGGFRVPGPDNMLERSSTLDDLTV